MKIFISSDIEGVSGVVNTTHTTPSGSDYNRARKLMTDEVNAAIRGAVSAGATEIIVNDSHGPMTNLLIEDLVEDAELITGKLKLLGMMEGIDKTCNAALFLGYHARHNTPGVLAHTYSSMVISEVKINGKVVGEFEFNAMIARHFGVPVVFVSGDDILREQVREFDADVEALVVKKAVNRNAAKCMLPKKVHRLIEQAVNKVLSESLKSSKPTTVKEPVELEVAFLNNGMAEAANFIPGITLIAPNRVKYQASDIVEAYKVRAAITTLAASSV
jgi:D-amino peptidase